jgi:hypothetical protein
MAAYAGRADKSASWRPPSRPPAHLSSSSSLSASVLDRTACALAASALAIAAVTASEAAFLEPPVERSSPRCRRGQMKRPRSYVALREQAGTLAVTPDESPSACRYRRSRAIPVRRPATISSWRPVGQRCHRGLQRRRNYCAGDLDSSSGRELDLDRTAGPGVRRQRLPIWRNRDRRKVDFTILAATAAYGEESRARLAPPSGDIRTNACLVNMSSGRGAFLRVA